MEATVISDRLDAIRRLIEQEPLASTLKQDQDTWLKLLSSVTALEDTDEAIRAFDFVPINRQALGEQIGERYLALYGVFQALYLQQDAVTHLCEALAVPFQRQQYPGLQRARDLRNSTIGHPTHQDRPKPVSRNFFSRTTINHPETLRLYRYGDDGSEIHDDFDINLIVTDQMGEIDKLLDVVVTNLKGRIQWQV